MEYTAKPCGADESRPISPTTEIMEALSELFGLRFIAYDNCVALVDSNGRAVKTKWFTSPQLEQIFVVNNVAFPPHSCNLMSQYLSSVIEDDRAASVRSIIKELKCGATLLDRNGDAIAEIPQFSTASELRMKCELTGSVSSRRN